MPGAAGTATVGAAAQQPRLRLGRSDSVRVSRFLPQPARQRLVFHPQLYRELDQLWTPRINCCWVEVDPVEELFKARRCDRNALEDG